MLLELRDVSKTYQLGDDVIQALCHVNLAIDKGEFVAVMGPSGSGKSTFLQVASMLAVPTSGTIFLKDKDVTAYNESERARLRNQEIGFIFQSFNLLARTSALDNVALPLIYAKASAKERHDKSKAMLERVGLADRLKNTPAQLSGGQQQRVAIARALVNEPAIIFADEPTGNLDSKSGDDVKRILNDLHEEGRTIILVTHESDVAEIASRHIFFKDGEIISDKPYRPVRIEMRDGKREGDLTIVKPHKRALDAPTLDSQAPTQIASAKVPASGDKPFHKNHSRTKAKKQDSEVCFIIDNYDEQYQADPDCITKLETALAFEGAPTTKIDFPSKRCCVHITDQTVSTRDVLNILRRLGFQAKLEGK